MLTSLGYLTVATRDMDRWRHFALRVLGFAEGSGPDPDALYLRMDERAARVVVVPGETDQVMTVGWEVRDGAALRAVVRALEAADIGVERLSPEEADSRRAEEVVAFTDPAGTPVEVFHGPVLDHSPVVTPYGARFVTGAQGLGHVVLPVTDPERAFTFYTEVLGFRPRGAFRIPAPPEFGPMRVRFLGINERHHSLALCPAPHGGAPGLVHVMVEVDSLDAVGQALDRVLKDDYSLSSTLGRHTNDKMVSFYVRAPGGWDIEFGTDGMRVDETCYTAEEITADSYWGHDWSGSQPLTAM
ncbi:Putative 2,3-dihydroxybiphenyl 1,2-dioxygenase or glyoxalase/bleomycin resistance protein [Mycobacteroides abscessus subsp. bolletii]|uniref:biphenyl-2,3-diol 1,2-dioxygenase n=1 Tax=Mycobacteroides abscessus TaxID=36809 RepID=UPI00092A58E4|nr:biphenyl-2,3-diol 1,2-dioxygenase [Mycobacteroides abscessus]MDO3336300.1 biphenyl-2,3-diol 1,2-dioxygenase [Mycobacteroides abscessus subsp. bolletii]QSM89259.1 biphenyl-2,3-diol 1,2-dioxygenase [Mycobacteroides abscessus subsp. bolletii]SHY46770.1 Putative 2,3-dihydroxybiphenyl 1,2-dioxygenase or glyoxalase/bleomycin resistance protein [Mycobacteroides abscessus subsp. bolletii]SIC91259.1 putative 2,3-dihydroxybiphenyl 1,2-dioxygenase or glyoxalase/bleomycin resistance protein [Mycobactero